MWLLVWPVVATVGATFKSRFPAQDDAEGRRAGHKRGKQQWVLRTCSMLVMLFMYAVLSGRETSMEKEESVVSVASSRGTRRRRGPSYTTFSAPAWNTCKVVENQRHVMVC